MEKKKLNLETTLKKATIEMLLLNLLKEQDMYGYQLSQELKKRSSGLYTILEGSMYPILYRYFDFMRYLNDSGYISFFEKKVGRRQTRIYYHLEDNGLMYLDNLQTSFQQYVNLIQFLLTSKEGETYEEKTG